MQPWGGNIMGGLNVKPSRFINLFWDAVSVYISEVGNSIESYESDLRRLESLIL